MDQYIDDIFIDEHYHLWLKNRIEMRVPPAVVRVPNSYSATVDPAVLWAVTCKLYQVAGLRSKTTKLPPGLTWLDTRVHSWLPLERRQTII